MCATLPCSLYKLCLPVLASPVATANPVPTMAADTARRRREKILRAIEEALLLLDDETSLESNVPDGCEQ